MKYGKHMSRVGKQSIQIPEGVEVKIADGKVFAKGPKGSLDFEFHPDVKVEMIDKEVKLSVKEETKQTKSLWGLTRVLVANMIEGGATPISSASILQKMGFKIILYPLSVLFANTFASLEILKELKKSGTTTKLNKKLVSFDEFNDIVELSKFRKLEERYSTLNKKKKSR